MTRLSCASQKNPVDKKYESIDVFDPGNSHANIDGDYLHDFIGGHILLFLVIRHLHVRWLLC